MGVLDAGIPRCSSGLNPPALTAAVTLDADWVATPRRRRRGARHTRRAWRCGPFALDAGQEVSRAPGIACGRPNPVATIEAPRSDRRSWRTSWSARRLRRRASRCRSTRLSSFLSSQDGRPSSGSQSLRSGLQAWRSGGWHVDEQVRGSAGGAAGPAASIASDRGGTHGDLLASMEDSAVDITYRPSAT
jgi:hypothetical protein